MSTLAELESRVDAIEAELKQSRPADLRRLAETTYKLLDDARDRMSKVEIRLEGISSALAILTASQAEMRGELNAKIEAVRGELKAEIHAVRSELKADVAGLRRDMPSIVADAMREVLRNNKG
jgi:chromosome segregation ATPase